jgi:hypothetical protein
MIWGLLSCGAVGRTVLVIYGENLLMANLQQERVTSLDVMGVLKCKYIIKFNKTGNFRQNSEK